MATIKTPPRTPHAKANRCVVNIVADFPAKEERDPETGALVRKLPPIVEVKYQLADADGNVTGWTEPVQFDDLANGDKSKLRAWLKGMVRRHMAEAALTVEDED